MLSLFPQILFLAPAGITLLRIVAALYFAYIAWEIYAQREEFERITVPIVGYLRKWMVILSVCILDIIAVLLFLGAWTQVVALLGALALVKHLLFYRLFADISPFPKSTYVLLLCITLVLVVSGAGAFAFDLPL